MQTVTTQTESIRRDFPYSYSALTGDRMIYRGGSGGTNARSLEVRRYVCALSYVKVNVLPCVHVDACLIFYLESLTSGPMEYSTRATSYRCMRAANQIFLSVNVHARGQRGHNRISRTGNSRVERRSEVKSRRPRGAVKAYGIFDLRQTSRRSEVSGCWTALPFSTQRYTRKSLGRCIMQNRAH